MNRDATSQLWIVLYLGCAWGWIVSIKPVQEKAVVRLSIPLRAGDVIVMLAANYFLANGLWLEILNLPLYEEQNLQKISIPIRYITRGFGRGVIFDWGA
ncbi:MAG: hypothetical protein WBD81_03925 [Collimonas pratensis]|uniref:hypothetical protein n=1 Tax=Collimonas pratensis TaxID=279113 RepID=UPI003C73A813